MNAELYLHAGSGPCRAVLMTAKHLNLAVTINLIDFHKKDHMRPEFLKINPTHVVPTLVDGDFCLWESRAIQAYLVNKYAPQSCLYPKEVKARALVDRVLNYDAGAFFRAFDDNFYLPIFYGKTHDPGAEVSFRKQMQILEDVYLAHTQYVAGSYVTIADLSLLAEINFTETAGFDLKPYPKVNAWLQRLKVELPYYDEVNKQPLDDFRAAYSGNKNLNIHS